MLDEFSRVEAIKGQQRGVGRQSLFAPSRRRPVIAEALAECPVGTWVDFDEFSRFMQASGMEFNVTRNPWHLYIVNSNYGSLGYAGYHGWSILQGRYLLCLLFEYAATLGLIDIAYTHPAGARDDFWDIWGADDLEYLSRYGRPGILPSDAAWRVLPGTCPKLRAGNSGDPHAGDRLAPVCGCARTRH